MFFLFNQTIKKTCGQNKGFIEDQDVIEKITLIVIEHKKILFSYQEICRSDSFKK